MEYPLLPLRPLPFGCHRIILTTAPPYVLDGRPVRQASSNEYLPCRNAAPLFLFLQQYFVVIWTWKVYCSLDLIESKVWTFFFLCKDVILVPFVLSENRLSMHQDIETLRQFYSKPLGSAVATILAERVSDLWASTKGLNVLGVGYPLPVLPPFTKAKRCIALMPATQGAVPWSEPGRGVASTLSDEARTPFADGMFERVIVLHGIEEADSMKQTIRELWRIMAPNGRIIVASANRHGLWTRAESTPFGHGRSCTRHQLISLLSDLFRITASTNAVFMPPLKWKLITDAASAWERVGSILWPNFGGAVLIEAVKKQYIEPSVAKGASVLDLLPITRPAVSRDSQTSTR